MGTEQDAGFVRQRRNLMVISFVLLFAEVAELRISELNVFGNKLVLGESFAVSIALWVAGFYWLWRFYQYSRPFIAGTLQSAIQTHTQSLAPTAAVGRILRENPTLSEPFGDAPELKPQFSIAELVHWGQGRDFLDIEISLNKSVAGRGIAISQGTGRYRFRLTKSELRPLRWRAWINLIVHTTHFTDLILPYVLFFMPMTYMAYKGVRTML